MERFRLGKQQQSGGTVRRRIHELRPDVRVPRQAGPAEQGARVGFLRLVVEDHSNFAARFDPGIVVVLVFRSGDPVTSENQGAAISTSERELPRKSLPVCRTVRREPDTNTNLDSGESEADSTSANSW